MVSFDIYHMQTEKRFDYTDDAWVVDVGDFFGTGSPGLPTTVKLLVKAEWSKAHASFFDVRSIWWW